MDKRPQERQEVERSDWDAWHRKLREELLKTIAKIETAELIWESKKNDPIYNLGISIAISAKMTLRFVQTLLEKMHTEHREQTKAVESLSLISETLKRLDDKVTEFEPYWGYIKEWVDDKKKEDEEKQRFR